MIRPRDVMDQSLEQLFGREGRKAYEQTVRLVELSLFSSYDGRRQYAKAQLGELFDADLELASLATDGEVYAYLRFSGTPQYILVRRFSEDTRLAERAPDAREVARWGAVRSEQVQTISSEEIHF